MERRLKDPEMMRMVRKYSIGFLAAWLSVSPVQAERKTLIIAIGDSTTAGTPFEKETDVPYTAWLTKKHPDWEVINQGIPGETTDQIRFRFEEALKLNPRFVIILAGINDIYQDLPLDNTAKNLAFMVQRAKAKFAMPIIGTVLPFNTASKKQNKQIAELNRWIKKMSDTQNIPWVDFNTAVADTQNPDKLNGSPDQIHPDQGGYRAMALAVIPIIEDMQKAFPK